MAAHVSELLKALANERRLLILCHLAEDEKSVGELAGELDMRQSAVSQQLALLRKDGLVEKRRDAQTIFYSLARSDVSNLIEFLFGEYCAPKSKKQSRK